MVLALVMVFIGPPKFSSTSIRYVVPSPKKKKKKFSMLLRLFLSTLLAFWQVPYGAIYCKETAQLGIATHLATLSRGNPWC